MATKCQSCGMPMARDRNGGGTEADGSHSMLYCSLCYDKGALLQPDFSASDMQKHCVEQLHKKGVPRFLGWLMTRGISRLGRWAG